MSAPTTTPPDLTLASSTGGGQVSGPPVVLLLMPAGLALAWLVSKVQWVWTRQPELQFGWIVLMLSAYLAWENWPRRPAVRARVAFLNTVMAAGSLGWLALVQVYQAAFGTNAASLCGHALGTVLLIGANLHWAFGWGGIRVFSFPVLFLLVAMPLPSAIQNPITHGLQALVAALNVELLNLLGIPAQRVGSLIHLPTGTVGIDEACSGIRSLQSSVMATLFIGYLTLRSNAVRTLLFFGGLAIAVLGNLLRSLFLSLTASTRGVSAVDQVHDAAGWSILLFTACGVGLLAWYLSRLEKRALMPLTSLPLPSTPDSPDSRSTAGSPGSLSSPGRPRPDSKGATPSDQ